MIEQTPNILERTPFIPLLFSSRDLPAINDQSIIDRIQATGLQENHQVEIIWQRQETSGFVGNLRFANHQVQISGLAYPLPHATVQRTVNTSPWQPQIKAAMRQHQSHISLVYMGEAHDPIEKMIALYTTARAFTHENLLGIANENAWTAHPVADFLSPQSIISYQEQIPFSLWFGTIRFFVDDQTYWLVTKGHHIFDVPDLAYHVRPGEDEEEITKTFINIFYYMQDPDVFVTAGDTLTIQGTAENMRFAEVTAFEDILMGPSGTLVVEKIKPDEINL
jgi:hypothetical protein